MSSDFGGREDDRGDWFLCSIDFEFKQSGEPTFRDVLDDCFTGTSGYDQVTFASEAGVFSGDFALDAILMVSNRMGQLNNPPNEDSLATTSSPD